MNEDTTPWLLLLRNNSTARSTPAVLNRNINGEPKHAVVLSLIVSQYISSSVSRRCIYCFICTLRPFYALYEGRIENGEKRMMLPSLVAGAVSTTRAFYVYTTTAWDNVPAREKLPEGNQPRYAFIHYDIALLVAL